MPAKAVTEEEEDVVVGSTEGGMSLMRREGVEVGEDAVFELKDAPPSDVESGKEPDVVVVAPRTTVSIC